MIGRTVKQLAHMPGREAGRLSAFSLFIWLQIPIFGLLLWAGYEGTEYWWQQPLRDVEIVGELKETNAKGLRLQVWEVAEGRYLDIDMNQVKAVLEANPWVKQAEVRRRWPLALQVHIREETAAARWGDKQLLSSEGRIFTPGNVALIKQEKYQALPYLQGPKDQTLVMMEQYGALNQLLRPLNLRIASLNLEDRGAWSLELDNGIKLLLGRNDTIDKVRRFSRVYGAELGKHSEKIERIDVRYTNGLAVAWNNTTNAGLDY